MHPGCFHVPAFLVILISGDSSIIYIATNEILEGIYEIRKVYI